MEQEIWRPVVGYEGYYEVSNLARVKSVHRIFLRKDGHPMVVNERIRKQCLNTSGYLYLRLCKSGVCSTIEVHLIVARAWVNMPDYSTNLKLEVNHKDGNKLNCLPDNLEWVTHEYNMFHAWGNKLCKSNSGISKEELIKIFELREKGVSYNKISKQLRISKTHVVQIVNGKRLKRKTYEL